MERVTIDVYAGPRLIRTVERHRRRLFDGRDAVIVRRKARPILPGNRVDVLGESFPKEFSSVWRQADAVPALPNARSELRVEVGDRVSYIEAFAANDGKALQHRAVTIVRGRSEPEKLVVNAWTELARALLGRREGEWIAEIPVPGTGGLQGSAVILRIEKGVASQQSA